MNTCFWSDLALSYIFQFQGIISIFWSWCGTVLKFENFPGPGAVWSLDVIFFLVRRGAVHYFTISLLLLNLSKLLPGHMYRIRSFSWTFTILRLKVYDHQPRNVLVWISVCSYSLPPNYRLQNSSRIVYFKPYWSFSSSCLFEKSKSYIFKII